MSAEINKRAAGSGRVDYGDPVEIHDTPATRIEMVPFFIPRSHGTDFAIKVIHTDKRHGWSTKEISISPAGSRRLLEALGTHLAVAEAEQGEYLVLRSDGVSGIEGFDVEELAAAVEQLLSADDRVAEHLVHNDLGAELLHALRTDLRLRELRNAVAELTNHLREGESSESTYQAWCDEHSWAFGNAYVVNDELRAISASDQVDLLLPRHLGGFRDLIELKRPDMTVLRWDDSHKNWYWSADASKAIGQCHRYLDVLHDEVADGQLRDSPEVVAYHPRATIVIGRSSSWEHSQHKALHGLNRRLADISVITYDHLLEQARSTLQLVEAPDHEPQIIVPPAPDWDLEEPF